MYETNLSHKTEDSCSLLSFLAEREEALKAVQKRSRLMRCAYVGTITVCAALGVYIGVIIHLI